MEETLEMSEKQEHRKRYNLRLMYLADFEKWLNREPPIYRVIAWHRWKKNRPEWKEAEQRVKELEL